MLSKILEKDLRNIALAKQQKCFVLLKWIIYGGQVSKEYCMKRMPDFFNIYAD